MELARATLPMGLTVFNLLISWTSSLWGISLVPIFLLWKLVYLALVSGVVRTLVFIVTVVVGNRMRKRLGWSITQELGRLRVQKK